MLYTVIHQQSVLESNSNIASLLLEIIVFDVFDVKLFCYNKLSSSFLHLVEFYPKIKKI